jgi:hypothetical protein
VYVVGGGAVSDHTADICQIVVRIAEILNGFFTAHLVVIFQKGVSCGLFECAKQIALVDI